MDECIAPRTVELRSKEDPLKAHPRNSISNEIIRSLIVHRGKISAALATGCESESISPWHRIDTVADVDEPRHSSNGTFRAVVIRHCTNFANKAKLSDTFDGVDPGLSDHSTMISTI